MRSTMAIVILLELETIFLMQFSSQFPSLIQQYSPLVIDYEVSMRLQTGLEMEKIDFAPRSLDFVHNYRYLPDSLLYFHQPLLIPHLQISEKK